MKIDVKKLFKIFGITAGTCAVLAGVGLTVNALANERAYKDELALASSFNAVSIENQITPTKDSDGNFVFSTDRDFKILQLTDIHLRGGYASKSKDIMAINAIAKMISVEKPDLVIATGDTSFPSVPIVGNNNNMQSAEIFAQLMESLGVYWTITYGNHDAESYATHTKEELSDFYCSDNLKYCLFQKGDPAVDGYGNNIIKIKNSAGEITQAIFTMDSNMYSPDGGYDNIHENQIEWYKEAYNKLNQENAEFGSVNSLLFLHIPPVEYDLAWQEYKENEYKDTENVKYYYGFWGENCCPPKYDDNLFETMLTIDGEKAIFCGHDHVNTYSVDYMGIRLTYGMSIDYLAYRNIHTMGLQRGCTVITAKPDGTFTCAPENYYQEKYAHDSREEVTMQTYEGYNQ